MTDTSTLEKIEERIRRENEARLETIREVVTLHEKLTRAREAFLAEDEANTAELQAALAAATRAGFSDKDLTEWQPKPLNDGRKKTRRRPRATKNTAASPSTTAVDTDTATATTDSSERSIA